MHLPIPKVLSATVRGKRIQALREAIGAAVGRPGRPRVAAVLNALTGGARDQSTLSGWERGTDISFVDAQGLARLAGIPPDWLAWEDAEIPAEFGGLTDSALLGAHVARTGIAREVAAAMDAKTAATPPTEVDPEFGERPRGAAKLSKAQAEAEVRRRLRRPGGAG